MKCFGFKILFLLLLAFHPISCGPGTDSASFSPGGGFTGTNLNISPGGGIGGSGGPSVSTGGGIGGTGKTIYGKVTALEDVTVNGITLDTSEASFTFDDTPGTENDLKVGMLVKVDALVDETGTTGKAVSIIFDNELDGPVQAIDLAQQTFVALGQTLRVDDSTVFSNINGLGKLKKGDMVEISGFITPEGIQTTWVEHKKNQRFIPYKTPVEIKGKINALDVTTQTFYVGKQLVDYSGNPLMDRLTSNDLKEGLSVEVKGKLDFSEILHATKIEWEDTALFGIEGDVLKIEGVVTNDPTGEKFELGNLIVQYNLETEFEHGSPAGLEKGVFLEVEGTLDFNLVLVAQEISFRRGGNLRLAGSVETVDLIENTVGLMGTAVQVIPSTHMKDNRDGLRPFGLQNVQIGDSVEIIGSWKNGQILARQLVREDFEFYSNLQGKVGRISAPDFVVLDRFIETHGGTHYWDNKNKVISENEFFSRLKEGSLVQVEGVYNGQSFIAFIVKLKN